MASTRTTRVLGLVLIAGLVPAQPSVRAQAPAEDAQLAAGIREVREGDLEAAVLTLDGVVQRLAKEEGRVRDLARARIYLAIAHFGLGQQEKAKADLIEAWRADRTMTLSAQEFPPNIIEQYEEVRKEAAASVPSPAPSPAAAVPPRASDVEGPPMPTASPATAKKGGSKLPLVILGVAGVGAGVAALAAGGGSSPTSAPNPTTTPVPAPTPASTIAFVDSAPAPGSTVDLRFGVIMNFAVTLNTTVTGHFVNAFVDEWSPACFFRNDHSDATDFTAGVRKVVSVHLLDATHWGTSLCPVPQDIDRILVGVASRADSREFLVSTTITPHYHVVLPPGAMWLGAAGTRTAGDPERSTGAFRRPPVTR